MKKSSIMIFKHSPKRAEFVDGYVMEVPNGNTVMKFGIHKVDKRYSITEISSGMRVVSDKEIETLTTLKVTEQAITALNLAGRVNEYIDRDPYKWEQTVDEFKKYCEVLNGG